MQRRSLKLFAPIALTANLVTVTPAMAQPGGASITDADKSDYRCWLVSSIMMAKARPDRNDTLHGFFEQMSLYYMGKLFGRNANADLTANGTLAKTVDDKQNLSPFVDACYKELDHNIGTFSESGK